jgi:CelD/BcsL family acetyltransferase involved in cellulose biosynthesis
LQLVVLKEIPDEDPVLGRQWNLLVDNLDDPQVFYTYEWALAVQRAYRVQLPPLFVLGYENENLCAVAALTVDDRRRQASFLCATTGDYCDFLSAAEIRGEFVTAVLDQLGKNGVERIVFANLPADSPTNDALRSAAKSFGFHLFARTGYDCAKIVLDRLDRGRDGHPRIPGQSRLNKLEKMLGRTRLEHRQSWQDVRSILPEFTQAHIGRFLCTGRISILTDPTRKTFLEDLGKLLSRHDWLVISRLLIEERPAAWHYGFKFHSTWFWYQPTFDTALEKYSPGSCLLTEIVQDAIASRSVSAVDLGLGAEGYKTHFANASRRTLYVTAHRSWSGYWWTIARYRLAEAARSSPLLEKTANKLRQTIRNLRKRMCEDAFGVTLGWLVSRVLGLFWSQTEVNFYRGEFSPDGSVTRQDTHLVPLRLEHLAQAATIYRDDEETASYLLRAANRLHRPDSQGYVLTDSGGHAMHFAWVAPFHGFYCAELNSKLDAHADAVLLFDCWTPSAVRGRGYYEAAITQLGKLMQSKGKAPWIFGATENSPSIRGIERAGFHLQYYVVRKRRWSWRRVFDNLPPRTFMHIFVIHADDLLRLQAAPVSMTRANGRRRW